MVAALQSHKIGTISKPSSEADKNDKISCFKGAFPNGFIKRERDGGRGVVPIFLNGNDHLIFNGPVGKSELGFEILCSTFNDPCVGLMGNDFVNLIEQ